MMQSLREFSFLFPLFLYLLPLSSSAAEHLAQGNNLDSRKVEIERILVSTWCFQGTGEKIGGGYRHDLANTSRFHGVSEAKLSSATLAALSDYVKTKGFIQVLDRSVSGWSVDGFESPTAFLFLNFSGLESTDTFKSVNTIWVESGNSLQLLADLGGMWSVYPLLDDDKGYVGISPYIATDIDGDGTTEVIFSEVGGYSWRLVTYGKENEKWHRLLVTCQGGD